MKVKHETGERRTFSAILVPSAAWLTEPPESEFQDYFAVSSSQEFQVALGTKMDFLLKYKLLEQERKRVKNYHWRAALIYGFACMYMNLIRILKH